MLIRKVEKSIKKWIRHAKNALLVTGARQVGKTYSIRACLKAEQQDYIEINLIAHPEIIPSLEKASTAHDLNLAISLVTGKTPVPGQTVLFIDEVQECKELVTRIKFWVDEGSYRFVLSGSLLGVELTHLKSAPVGYLDELTMYPLDLEEFVLANGIGDGVVDECRRCFLQRQPVTDLLHDTMMEQFRRYLVVGGMPAAVQEFVDTGDLNQVMSIQRNIIAQYKRDFTKYETEQKKLMLIAVYDNIPAELLKQNRRFNLADLQKGLRFERAEDSFLWLQNAGVALAVYNATEPRVSLNQNKKSNLLKLYSSDVGLLTCQYGKATKRKLINQEPHLNCGGIFENAVATELKAHGFDLYYYNSRKSGELDFVIEYDNAVLPIEVKSGKDYYVHSAISNVADNREYDIETACVLADCNISVNGKICYLPVYMCMFIQEDDTLPVLR